jgi:hypothetical protein
LKETPVGERAPYHKGDINKKGLGWMTGWEVPDITVYDADWNMHSLKALTADKNAILPDGILPGTVSPVISPA